MQEIINYLKSEYPDAMGLQLEVLEEVEGANDLSYHVHVQKLLLQHRVELFPVLADDLDDVVDDVFAHCFPEPWGLEHLRHQY